MKVKHLFWFLPIIMMISCARQSTPGGGPMDTIPPVAFNVQPRDQQLKVRASALSLEFDEVVTLANPKDQIIVTPSIGKDYEIEVRGKKVLLTFEKPLDDSTTYTFNFRDAIVDITEKNPARNLKIAFSTGPYIDSMRVEGIVQNALSQKTLQNATVAIQVYSDTFNIFTDPAIFFTKTDKDGKFRLDNLKPGLYTIYAINDQNKNLIADPKSEAYGFKSDSILLDENKKNITLNLVRLDLRPLKLTAARPYNTYVNIKSSKNLKDFSVTAPEDSVNTVATFGADRANIILYNTFPGKDSLKLRTVLTDSANLTFDTTFYARFPTRDAKPEPFSIEIQGASILAEKGAIEFNIKMSKPFKEINFDSIFFEVDTANVVRFDKSNTTYNSKDRILTFKKLVDKSLFIKPEITEPAPTKTEIQVQSKTDTIAKPKVKKVKILNRLIMGKALVISIENDSSKRLQKTIQPQKTEDLGVIIVETKTPPKKTIIQLLGQDKQVKQQVIHKSTVTFNDIPPGQYQIRLIIDSNENGEWDPGNYFENIEPEPVRYWLSEKQETVVPLKANHEIGPLLITY